MGDEAFSAQAGLKLSLVRVFHAPPAEVFRMWSEPEELRQWCAPAGFTVAEGEGDFRPGGAWSCRMVGPDGVAHRLGGVYQEIIAPRRLLTSHAWEDSEGRPGPETLLDVRFEDLDGQTRLSLRQGVFSSRAAPVFRRGPVRAPAGPIPQPGDKPCKPVPTCSSTAAARRPSISTATPSGPRWI